MSVVTWQVTSATPERDAWEKLLAWAKPRGFLDDLGEHPVFGFNNPPPSRENAAHGYEWWMRVDPAYQGGDGVVIK